MIIERNGVVFFSDKEDYKDHAAYKELSKVSLGDVRFPSGFFLVDEDGKTFVVPASAEDRRQMILKAFPDAPEAALTSLCYERDGHCIEGCAGLRPRHKCMPGFDGSRRQYGCARVGVE